MKLQTLAGADFPAGCGDVDIVGITADSRQVRPGWLFAAMPGSKADGARFVPEALSKGAAAILAGIGAEIAAPEGVPVIKTAEPRRTLALMAARFYGAQPETIFAVTGTSGKTSVADFTRQILAALGHKAASLGTIGLVKPDGSVYGSLTTPDPVTLHATLAELAARGRHAPRLRGLLARPRPAPARRRARSRPPPSPISAATISTITRPSTPTSPPSCGCSPSCCRRTASPSSTRTPSARAR